MQGQGSTGQTCFQMIKLAVTCHVLGHGGQRLHPQPEEHAIIMSPAGAGFIYTRVARLCSEVCSIKRHLVLKALG